MIDVSPDRPLRHRCPCLACSHQRPCLIDSLYASPHPLPKQQLGVRTFERLLLLQVRAISRVRHVRHSVHHADVVTAVAQAERLLLGIVDAAGQEQFVFEGGEYLTAYAKYLLEYLTEQFKETKK